MKKILIINRKIINIKKYFFEEITLNRYNIFYNLCVYVYVYVLKIIKKIKIIWKIKT